MNSKTALHEALNKKVSKVAITNMWDGYEDNWFVLGKWCRVTPVDGEWDVWVCNPKDLAVGLSNRKVSNIAKAIFSLIDRKPEIVFFEGEAQLTLTSEEVIRCLKPLGIRRARALSPEQTEALVQRMAAMRQGGSLGTPS